MLLSTFLLINLKKLLRPDLIAYWSLWSWKLVISAETLSYSLTNSDVDAGHGNIFVSKKFFLNLNRSLFISLGRRFLWLTNTVTGRYLLIDSLMKWFIRIKEFSKLLSEEIDTQSVSLNNKTNDDRSYINQSRTHFLEAKWGSLDKKKDYNGH